jgi:hypothetical protein
MPDILMSCRHFTMQPEANMRIYGRSRDASGSYR